MSKRHKRENDTSKERFKRTGIIWLVAIAITLFINCFFGGFDRYYFVDTFIFPLWYVALGIGVIIGILFSLKWVSKDTGIAMRIFTFVVATFVITFLSGMILAHMNHALDFNDAVRYTAFIEDKEYTSKRKTPDEYEFKLIVNGESMYINVSSKEYYNLEEGDLYVVEYHKGAFNEPYYIAVGGVSKE